MHSRQEARYLYLRLIPLRKRNTYGALRDYANLVAE